MTPLRACSSRNSVTSEAVNSRRSVPVPPPRGELPLLGDDEPQQVRSSLMMNGEALIRRHGGMQLSTRTRLPDLSRVSSAIFSESKSSLRLVAEQELQFR